MLQAWRCFIIHSCRTPLLCFRGGWGHCWRELPLVTPSLELCAGLSRVRGRRLLKEEVVLRFLRSHDAELHREKRAALVPGSLLPCREAPPAADTQAFSLSAQLSSVFQEGHQRGSDRRIFTSVWNLNLKVSRIEGCVPFPIVIICC